MSDSEDESIHSAQPNDDDDEGEELASTLSTDDEGEDEDGGGEKKALQQKESRKRKLHDDNEEEEEELDEDEEEDGEDGGGGGNDDMSDEEDLDDLPKRLRNKKLRERAKALGKTRGSGSGKRRRHRRQPTARDFIQDEVEVDDDEEDDEYEYGDDDLFGTDPSERAEAERAMREQERLRQSGQQRRRNKMADMTEEELARYFQERHAQSSSGAVVIDDGVYDSITENQNLPGTKDPNLWIVKCRMGEEKNSCLRLMRKCIAYQNTAEPLQIKSVVVKEGLRGMIYIEAFKLAHVKAAIKGVSALNQLKVTMVPIREMVDTLRVVKDLPVLKQGAYVRLKRTVYKDDLAQVDSVDVAQNRVHLKLVPRIDYTRMRGALRQRDDGEAGKKANKGKRPQPKLFDYDKIKQIGGDVGRDGIQMIFEGQHYIGGFLFKSFPMNAIIAEGIRPSLAEMEIFEESSNEGDFKRKLEQTQVKEREHNFQPGDTVEVTDGELVNLRGKVQSVEGDKVVILPEHEELMNEPLTVNASELRKYFKVGDHIRVINGHHEGNTGLALRVDENLVVMISDLNMDELQLLPRDLRLCTDVATGVDSLGQYRYHDLVMVDKDTAGVIVRLEKDYVHVLTMHGTVVKVKPQSLQGKKESKFAKALDYFKNTMQDGDLVRVIDGPMVKKKAIEEGRSGEIKHIYRTWAFIFSRQLPENGGLFVCKTRNLSLVGGKVSTEAISATVDTAELLRSPRPMESPRPHGGGGASATPFSMAGRSVRGEDGSMSVRGGAITPGGASFAGRPSGGGFNGGGPRRDNRLIGKTVKITQGPMKGYTGMVKDATDTSVRVELHAQPKTINIERSKVMEAGTGVNLALGGGFAAGFATPNPYDRHGRTPMYGGAVTPMYGGATTPMHDYGGGARTPMTMYGSTTPNPYGDGGGARTPGGEHISAWNPAATPAGYRGGGNRGDEDEDIDEGAGHYSGSGDYNQPSGSQMGATKLPVKFGGEGKGGAYTPMYASSEYSGAASPFRPPAVVASAPSGPTEVPEVVLCSGSWCAVDACVTLRPTFHDSSLLELEGSIRRNNSSAGEADVFFDTNDREEKIAYEFLLPACPADGNEARVIHGEHNGKKGTVKTVDEESETAVLECASDHSLIEIPIRLLCKMY